MKSFVVVREYARLTTDEVAYSLDQATVSQSAFDWLCEISSSFSKQGASLLHVENRRWLCLDSYVGIVETPCGTVLEILPKHVDETSDEAVVEARQLLCKMLETALDLPTRDTSVTDVSLFKHPLLEWVMQQFLTALKILVKRGLRFDYQNVEESQRYLRGQLDVNKQLRQPPGRSHIFNIRHDVFLPDRAENRLLKTALHRIAAATQQPETWRLSRELLGLLSEIPESRNIKSDFNLWRSDRLMAHYKNIHPWCRLILGEFMPLAVRGASSGISLLFPMEKLFEHYVEVKLRQHLMYPFHLKSQAKTFSLCEHKSSPMFQLMPDLLIQSQVANVAVLDTKWKRINQNKFSDKFDLSQGDFYQMFAYGHKYLSESKGDLVLIYPRWTNLTEAIADPFVFGEELNLWVVPFDLKNDLIIWPEQMETRNFIYRHAA